MKKENAPLAENIYHLAESFYAASSLVHDEIQFRMKNDSYEYVYPLFSVMITNHAFAIELYLKCLNIMDNDSFKRRHELDLLFQSLKPTTRAIIKEYYGQFVGQNIDLQTWNSEGRKIPEMDFDTILNKARTAFVEFRYSFEQQQQSYLIADIVKAARKYIQEQRPGWGSIKRLNPHF